MTKEIWVVCNMCGGCGLVSIYDLFIEESVDVDCYECYGAGGEWKPVEELEEADIVGG